LQRQECVGGQYKLVQVKILKIGQEKHVQAHWREKTVLLSELGEQELKLKGDYTNSVFLYLVSVKVCILFGLFVYNQTGIICQEDHLSTLVRFFSFYSTCIHEI
jgi:hypothetical protein